MATQKQRAAARKNIKKAGRAAKRKQTLKHLPKKTRRALGQQAAKVRQGSRRRKSDNRTVESACLRVQRYRLLGVTKHLG